MDEGRRANRNLSLGLRCVAFFIQLILKNFLILIFIINKLETERWISVKFGLKVLIQPTPTLLIPLKNTQPVVQGILENNKKFNKIS